MSAKTLCAVNASVLFTVCVPCEDLSRFICLQIQEYAGAFVRGERPLSFRSPAVSLRLRLIALRRGKRALKGTGSRVVERLMICFPGLK